MKGKNIEISIRLTEDIYIRNKSVLQETEKMYSISSTYLYEKYKKLGQKAL